MRRARPSEGEWMWMLILKVGRDEGESSSSAGLRILVPRASEGVVECRRARDWDICAPCPGAVEITAFVTCMSTEMIEDARKHEHSAYLRLLCSEYCTLHSQGMNSSLNDSNRGF